MDANGLRAAFTRYFADRGHTIVPSASLIPHDPSVLFTIAGMVPFKPYFVGEEPAPWPRATSIQKCFRTPDIEIIGTDTYHCTFFEMLGNFSFGDYFKEDAIPMAWELLTEILGHDGDRLWITVHDDDDEAEQIWIDKVGVRPERIQRMGDEDNFWAMGETGPCGHDSEIFFDKGEAYGHDGGPKHGGSDRFVEIWNLVFMQFDRDAAGTLNELPRKNIDTGAGLERNLPLLQGLRLRVRHRPVPAAHRHGGLHPRHRLRGGRAHRRRAPGAGRPRPRLLHARRRRRPPRQRGPRLRAAPGRAPGRAGGPPRSASTSPSAPRSSRRPPRCSATPTPRCAPSTTSSST